MRFQTQIIVKNREMTPQTAPRKEALRLPLTKENPMFSRRSLLASAVVLAFATPAFAMDEKAFSRAEFEAAQKAGKPILIEIHASWCPTCKAQAPIISELSGNPKFKDLVIYRVDFDTQKDAVKAFGARMQSTLIAYKGGKETARSVGDTKKESIAALLGSAI